MSRRRAHLQGPHGPVGPISAMTSQVGVERKDKKNTPEVEFRWNDVCGIHAEIEPCLPGLIVAWNVVLWVASKVGDVEPLFWEFVDLGQKFPAESDGFFLQWVKVEVGEGNGGSIRALK